MSQEFLKQLDELIRARYTLIYVLTWEEARAVRLLAQLAETQHKALIEWSITDGLRPVYDPTGGNAANTNRNRDAIKMLNEILQSDQNVIYVLKDFHKFFDGPGVVRQLRDLGDALRQTRKSVVMISPELNLPRELEKVVTVTDLPLPSYAELQALVKHTIEGARNSKRIRVNLSPAEEEAMIKATQGLTLTEAENALARALVRDQILDAADIQTVAEEKKQVIRKSGLLEYCEVGEALDAVGGMDILKDWLRKRVMAFGEEARAYGLPAPRGVLLMGVQGCGKSLVAKCVAATWRMPLLRMDVSRIFQGYIGSSEENMRKALSVAESLAPAVLWVDEIEKALSGVDGSSSTDGGTTARVVGQFLTWMQEKTKPVFVIATANNVRGLPPELMRKGRLDEIFFVDLPRAKERSEIFRIHLTKLRRNPAQFDLHALVRAATGFSGAEIEQAIISALHDSFFERRDLNTEDILRNIKETVPLSRTMQEDIEALRYWATQRARPVTTLAAKTGENESEP